jgi:hypothetical protein
MMRVSLFVLRLYLALLAFSICAYISCTSGSPKTLVDHRLGLLLHLRDLRRRQLVDRELDLQGCERIGILLRQLPVEELRLGRHLGQQLLLAVVQLGVNLLAHQQDLRVVHVVRDGHELL